MEGSARGEDPARAWIVTAVIVAVLAATVFGYPADRVDFQMKGHLIMLEVSVGGLERLKFALDTGSETSVVSPRVASELGTGGEKRCLRVWGQGQEALGTVLPTLRIGRLTFDRIKALIIDLPSVRGTRIDGLIGMDVLREVSVTIDFRSREILFNDPQDLPRTIKFYNQLPYIPLTLVMGKSNIHVKFDTGARGLVLYSYRPKDGPILTRKGMSIEASICGGNLNVKTATVAHLQLGEDSWTDVETFLLDRKRDENVGVEGNLGVDVLGLSVLQIEMSEGRLSWSK